MVRFAYEEREFPSSPTATLVKEVCARGKRRVQDADEIEGATKARILVAPVRNLDF